MPREHKLFPKISTDESSSRIMAGELHESTSASSPGSRSLIACVDLLYQLVHCAAKYRFEINTSEIFNKQGIEELRNFICQRVECIPWTVCEHCQVCHEESVVVFLETMNGIIIITHTGLNMQHWENHIKSIITGNIAGMLNNVFI